MHENSPPQRPRLAAGCRLTALAAVLACGAVSLAAGPAAQAAARPGTPAAVPPGNTVLTGVSAVSATDAWAVGYAGNGVYGQSLILHWNGTKWVRVTSPDPGGTHGTSLSAVSADSATDAWAVGNYDNSSRQQQTLTLHWNGTKWTQVASPNPGAANGLRSLTGVSAVSPADAWVVGNANTGANGQTQTLMLHWNGTKWARVTSPDPGGPTEFNGLNGVSAVTASNVYAVGYVYSSSASNALVLHTLVLHWNGTSWTQVTGVPSGGGFAVSTPSASDIWTVGYEGSTSGALASVALHSDGTAWTRDPTPNPGTSTVLDGVSGDAASDAWAVGSYASPNSDGETLALHWNGTKWAKVATPNPGGTTLSGGNSLNAVSAVTKSSAWAVGYFWKTPGPDQPLILHWNGTSWTQVASPF